MVRLDKVLDHLLLQLRSEGDVGLPAAPEALARAITAPEVPITSRRAAQVEELATDCCYAATKGDRIRITHIGLTRLERLYPELAMAH